MKRIAKRKPAKKSRPLNKKQVAFIAYHKGRGATSHEISRLMGGVPSPATIRRQIAVWGMPKERPNLRTVPVLLSSKRGADLDKAALARSRTSSDLASEVIAVCVKDQMFNAILDEE
jgi:hypothetical protein